MRKFDGFEPKHKVTIDIRDCGVCLVVDNIVVPHCDCDEHGNKLRK